MLCICLYIKRMSKLYVIYRNMYIYVYIYIYIHTCTYNHIPNVYTYVHTHIYIYIYISISFNFNIYIPLLMDQNEAHSTTQPRFTQQTARQKVRDFPLFFHVLVDVHPPKTSYNTVDRCEFLRQLPSGKLT